MKYILISLIINSINGQRVEYGQPSGAWGPFETQQACEAFVGAHGYPKGKLLCAPLNETPHHPNP